MNLYSNLPLLFFRFWYLDAPLGLLAYFISLNKAFLDLFSLQLCVRTFFKPIKNEYREGLVGFSIGMGMFVKTFLIIFDVLALVVLLLAECLFLLMFVGLPLIAVIVLFAF